MIQIFKILFSVLNVKKHKAERSQQEAMRRELEYNLGQPALETASVAITHTLSEWALNYRKRRNQRLDSLLKEFGVHLPQYLSNKRRIFECRDIRPSRADKITSHYLWKNGYITDPEWTVWK